MRILLAHPGKLRTVPMGRFALAALRALGHEVTDFDLSSQWADKLRDRFGRSSAEPQRSLNQRLRATVDQSRPELLFAIFGFDLSEVSLDYLKRRGVISACWWLNDPFQFSRALQKAPRYDLLFSNSLGSVSDYRAAGIQHAHWLPAACDPSVHRRAEPAPEYRCEVCFAGDWSALREQWCVELARHFELRIFGPWKRKLRRDSPLWGRVHDGFFSPESMARMFASASVVFNLHTWYGQWEHGTNPRLFEAAGCGACQVVDWKRDLAELFDCDSEIIAYTSLADLVPRMRDLLADSGSRLRLGENAQRRAYAQHTYRDRMQRLVQLVQGVRPR